MLNDRLLSKQEVVKIIKHEFDRWLKSQDPAYSSYKKLQCILSLGGFLSVTPVVPPGAILILSFDKQKDGDVLPLERVQRAVDNNWWDLQRIERTKYYKKILNETNGQQEFFEIDELDD